MAVDTHVESETGLVKMPDGTELFERYWPLENATATVAIVHGYGEHAARYDHVARRLNSEGFAVYSYDHRAHGKSPGTMGYIPKMQTLIDDCDVYMKHLSERIGHTPEFVFGHSMGGLITATYLEQFQPAHKGAVLSAGAFEIGENVNWIMRWLSMILSFLFPKLGVQAIPPSGLSRIPEEVAKYENDPLVYHGKIQARTGHEFMKSIAAVREYAGKISLPVLIQHGAADAVAVPAGSQYMHDHVTSTDKTLKFYDGAYHEVFNDLDAEPFLDDLVAWLKSHA